MNKRILLNTLIAISIPSICAFPTMTVLAEGLITPTQSQEVTIPQSSAIAITFPTSVTFDAGKKKSQASAASLTHPILDSKGNVIAPVNSPVSIQIQPVNGGAQIKAESIVIGGRVVPIFASSAWIPGKINTTTSGASQAQENQGVYSQLAGSVFRVFSSSKASNTNTDNIGTSVGTGLGIISGLSSPKTTRQVEIPTGSVYVLTLQVAVSVPAPLVQTIPSTQTTATSTPPPAQSQSTPNK